MGCSDRDMNGKMKSITSKSFCKPSVFSASHTSEDQAASCLTWVPNRKCFLEILNFPNSNLLGSDRNLAFQQSSQISLRLPDGLTIWKQWLGQSLVAPVIFLHTISSPCYTVSGIV